MTVSASTLSLRSIFPFEQELRTARLLRKHFWSFPHLERRIYTYLVCLCQRTLATIDIPLPARITNRTRFIESISGDSKHLERRMHTYLVCFCQRTLATIDVPFRARITNRTRFIESISGVLISTFRTKDIHMPCLFLPAHSSYDRCSLSSKNYEPHACYRKHFWCFPHLERRIYTYLFCFCQRTRTRLHSTVVYCCNNIHEKITRF